MGTVENKYLPLSSLQHCVFRRRLHPHTNLTMKSDGQSNRGWKARRLSVSSLNLRAPSPTASSTKMLTEPRCTTKAQNPSDQVPSAWCDKLVKQRGHLQIKVYTRVPSNHQTATCGDVAFQARAAREIEIERLCTTLAPSNKLSKQPGKYVFKLQQLHKDRPFKNTRDHWGIFLGCEVYTCT